MTTRMTIATRYSSLAGRCLFAIRCSLLAFFILGAAASAQTPQEVQKIAEQVIRRLDLQTELPRGPEPPKPVFIKFPQELLWVVVAIGIGVLLYAFRDMIPILRARQRGGAWSGEQEASADDGPRAPAVVLGAADELAAQGRFMEAMHVLLLQGLTDIRQRLDEQFGDSLTSREILRGTKLSEAGRAPLRDIIDRVELTYFGRRPAALPDYQACRASFNALAQALHGAPQGSAAA
jgi:hypothetical protein